ncbi:MAG: hypothetical protein COU69_01320 [Candidatus Pacebacteria bacterium CG10_big_fil_rev_8_21_14_0_10_56_10]|nr:MAG: hypothetical protein COU69_01320 [Candidatus Pacebacteria bacterium CG10_big_fil_rev_8_21_14_0_10_56_10]
MQLPWRLLAVLALFTSLFGLLWLRAWDVQVFRGSEFAQQALANRLYQLPLTANRGVITDRYGLPLAWNQRQYWLADQPDSLYSDLTPLDRQQALERLATQSGAVRKTNARRYALATELAHVIGYTGQVTSEELDTDPNLTIRSTTGKLGLEKLYDARLRGQEGRQTQEIDALLQRLRLFQVQPAQSGQGLATSLDRFLAEVAYQALGEQRGSVVISDARTGQVLVLVNKPSFNAELFTHPDQHLPDAATRHQLSQVFQDETEPMFNRALAGLYPPGSVFKLVTALAGLETGRLDSTTTVLDEGVIRVGEFEYSNWYFSQFGRTEGEIGLQRAISRSNDIFFYKAAEWIGPDRLAENARLLGFGRPTGIELSGEAAGLVPSPAWKETTVGERWFLGNTYHFGIGQGDVLVTPLQVNQLTQTLANGGTQCRPTLVAGAPPRCQEVGLLLDHLNVVLAGMIDACSLGGTAFPFFERNQHLAAASATTTTTATTETESVAERLRQGQLACKTGTSEFGGADERGFRRTHGWFTAIVEPRLAAVVDSPAGRYQSWRQAIAQHDFPRRLAITVLVESDDDEPFKEGSADAAPVAKQIIDWMEQGPE